MVRELTQEAVAHLRSLDVKRYLLAQGWERAPSRKADVGIFHRPDCEDAEVLLPLSLEFADLHEATARAVEEIARFERRPAAAVLRDLQRPRSDVLRGAVEEVARTLRPRASPAPDLFVGKVDALLGGPGPDGQMQGDVVLAAQVEDAIVKVRVDLGPEDYKVAGRAHLEDRYVSVRGVLRRGARVHRLEGTTGLMMVDG